METGNFWSLAQDLEQAFNQVGTSMMKVDFACKLLAYTYVLGGEATVLHKGLNAGIAIAAQKLNIKGGEIPHGKYLPMLQKYIKEMEQDRENTPWIKEIEERYELKSNTSTPKKPKANGK